VRPYAERALLDGVEVARGQQRLDLELEPGIAHVLRVEHVCCTPFTTTIPAPRPGQKIAPLKVPLEARPALLRVEGEPEAVVFLDGNPLGKAGDSASAPFAIPVPSSGERPYEAEGDLRLERKGAQPYTTRIRLRAGKEVTVAAPNLEPIP
jgi:serine/threonine-protein kinase